MKPVSLLISLALVACQAPLTAPIKTQLALSGQVDFPQTKGFQTQGVISANQTTLTLVYPPGHAQAGEIITTGLTESNGQFSLIRPADFRPAAGTVFKLTAHKRAGRGGQDQLSLSTFVRSQGDHWESITGSTTVLNSTTTALTVIDQQDTSLEPSDLINSVSYTPAATLPTPVGNTSLILIQQVQRLTHFLLEQGYDPQQFIRYANGSYYPAQPLSLTGQVLIDTRYCPECDLSFLNFSGQNLYLANLWGAQLQNSNLSSSNLNYANLQNANLKNTNLRQANLNQANLSQIQIDQTDFSLATWWDGQTCAEGSIDHCDYDMLLSPLGIAENGSNMAQDEAGNTLFVWRQSVTGMNSQIWGRYYDSAGIPKGPVFRLDTSTYLKTGAHVSMNKQGQSVVVWGSYLQDGDSNGVYARIFSPDGIPLSPEIQVNQTTANTQEGGQVSVDQDGNFVVSWHQFEHPYYDVYARRFDASGQPLSPEFKVHETSTYNQLFPSLAGTPTGEFIVVWKDENLSPHQTLGRSFNANGTPMGPSYQLSQSGGIQPSISVNDQGQVIAVWIGPDQNGSNSILARRWPIQSSPNSPEFKINNPIHTPASFRNPMVSLNRSGQFAVIWSGVQPNTSLPAGINNSYMRPFDSNNQPLTDQQTVHHFRGGPETTSISLGHQGQLWTSSCSVDFTFYANHAYARRRLFKNFY